MCYLSKKLHIVSLCDHASVVHRLLTQINMIARSSLTSSQDLEKSFELICLVLFNAYIFFDVNPNKSPHLFARGGIEISHFLKPEITALCASLLENFQKSDRLMLLFVLCDNADFIAQHLQKGQIGLAELDYIGKYLLEKDEMKFDETLCRRINNFENHERSETILQSKRVNRGREIDVSDTTPNELFSLTLFATQPQEIVYEIAHELADPPTFAGG